VDVNASGADSLVVYIVVKNRAEIPSSQKRKLEDQLREALQRVLVDYSVHFRWRTADEQKEVLTMKGLVDRPVSGPSLTSRPCPLSRLATSSRSARPGHGGSAEAEAGNA
jgi:hypothetical protein